jgi:hypothetical protein
MFHIDAPAAAIHEMERQMRINEDVLRYLTIKIDAFDEGPSVMMASRARDERPSQTPAATAPEEATAAAEEIAASATENASDDGEDNAEEVKA